MSDHRPDSPTENEGVAGVVVLGDRNVVHLKVQRDSGGRMHLQSCAKFTTKSYVKPCIPDTNILNRKLHVSSSGSRAQAEAAMISHDMQYIMGCEKATKVKEGQENRWSRMSKDW